VVVIVVYVSDSQPSFFFLQPTNLECDRDCSCNGRCNSQVEARRSQSRSKHVADEESYHFELGLL